MAWQNDLGIILRTIINDLDGTDYTNSKIEQILVVAAKLIKLEIDFAYIYAIDVEEVTISPDPVAADDNAFITLVSLKAACLILGAELKLAAAQSFRVQDASAVVDIKGVFEAKKALYDQLCKDYAKAKTDYIAGNLSSFAAILSPYTQDSISTHISLG